MTHVEIHTRPPCLYPCVPSLHLCPTAEMFVFGLCEQHATGGDRLERQDQHCQVSSLWLKGSIYIQRLRGRVAVSDYKPLWFGGLATACQGWGQAEQGRSTLADLIPGAQCEVVRLPHRLLFWQ